MKEKLLSFFCGELLVFIYMLFGGDMVVYLMKLVGTVGVGIIGGVAGMLGKDLYEVVKKRFFKR